MVSANVWSWPLLVHYERFKNVEPITERLCKYTSDKAAPAKDEFTRV